MQLIQMHAQRWFEDDFLSPNVFALSQEKGEYEVS